VIIIDGSASFEESGGEISERGAGTCRLGVVGGWRSEVWRSEGILEGKDIERRR